MKKTKISFLIVLVSVFVINLNVFCVTNTDKSNVRIKTFEVNVGNAKNVFYENIYLVYDSISKDTVIVDPGTRSEKLEKYIEDNNLKVKEIINTHGHRDHIGANFYYSSLYKVDILAHKSDKPFYTGKMSNNKPDGYLKDGDLLQIGKLKIKVIHTPGHSPGSLCFYIKPYLISGDTLFKRSIGRVFAKDKKELFARQTQLVENIKGKLFVLPNNTQVFPGHEDSTSIAGEKKDNPYIEGLFSKKIIPREDKQFQLKESENPTGIKNEPAGDGLVVIPLRVYADDNEFLSILRDDLNLKVNNKNIPIIDLLKKEISIKQVEDRKRRDYIISIFSLEYTGEISRGLDYFLNNIYSPLHQDGLIIVTPLGVYSMPVNLDIKSLKQRMEQVVSKDCNRYKKTRILIENNLERFSAKLLQKRVPRIYSCLADNFFSFTDVANFLQKYKNDFTSYKERYLKLSPKIFTGIASSLARRDSEKRWLHINIANLYPRTPQFNKLTQKIANFLNKFRVNEPSWSRILGKDMETLKTIMVVGNGFPGGKIINSLYSANISFYNILLNASDNSKNTNEYRREPEVERKWKYIAQKTGGMSTDSVNIEDSLALISNHKNIFYQVFFQFKEKIDNQEINLSLKDKKAAIFYPGRLNSTFFKSETNIGKEVIKIEKFIRNKSGFRFDIKGFAHTKNNSGMINLEVNILDNKGRRVLYKKGTLKAKKDTFSVSLPFKKAGMSKCLLKIIAVDLITMKSTKFKIDI